MLDGTTTLFDTDHFYHGLLFCRLHIMHCHDPSVVRDIHHTEILLHLQSWILGRWGRKKFVSTFSKTHMTTVLSGHVMFPRCLPKMQLSLEPVLIVFCLFVIFIYFPLWF